MHNRSTEDYIKNIFKLQKKGEKVTTSALAANLQLSDPSVSDMVKKLSEKGLVRYAPYRGVEMTEKGRRMALKILRRHRLWEMFLVRFLEYSWDEVHDEAERLEHVTSETMEQRLDSALGYPTTDPHGDLIPTEAGELSSVSYTALTEFDSGDVVRILRVSDENPEILQHASRLGLGLHTKLTIKEKLPFDGSLRIKIGSKEHYVSAVVAMSIFVEAV
jgi:DtxR family transcriptional regulator, Mn-dependent transcriptional regulator